MSYAIGPFTTGIAYFDSKADHSGNRDKIISFSNSWQYNKYVGFSLTAAHLESKGAEFAAGKQCQRLCFHFRAGVEVMNKICIVSSDSLFAGDLAQQILREVPETEILSADSVQNADMLLIDAESGETASCAGQKAEIPVVLFSSEHELSDYADVVIKKPFALSGFLQALQNKTLLPKVRRKECLNFKEYSLYPVKKEIVSSKSGKTTKLTEKEVDILKYLYQNLPAAASKEDLLENVWEYSAGVTTHTIETHIYRLRQKVEQDGGSQLILTENSGYRLNV